MKIEQLSREAQECLRVWAIDTLADGMVFEANGSDPYFWSWLCFQLWSSADRPDWFPRGKSATIQYIQGYLLGEACRSLPAEVRLPNAAPDR